jgi:bacteriophage CI repressor helix-turn-helix domain
MSNCVVSLFDNIDGEIRRKHTSQEELCNYLGIERRTYLNWKNKKSMPVTYFIMCAKYLNCTLDYLARDVQIGESTETKSA